MTKEQLPGEETHYLIGYKKVKAYRPKSKEDLYHLMVTPSTTRFQNVKHTSTGIQIREELGKKELVSELLEASSNYLDDRAVDETLAESMGPKILLASERGKLRLPLEATLQNVRLYQKTNRIKFTIKPLTLFPGDAEKFENLIEELGRKGSITISTKSNGRLKSQQAILEQFFKDGMYDMDFFLNPTPLLPLGAIGKGTLTMSTTSNINGSKINKRITSIVSNPAGIPLTAVSVISPDSSAINIDTNANHYIGYWEFNKQHDTLTIHSTAYYALFKRNISQTLVMRKTAAENYDLKYYRDGVIFNEVTLTKKP
jgi:hypothetical protein